MVWWWEVLEGVLFVLSPFTVLGIYDRRKRIMAKLNEWTKPKPEPKKEEEKA